MDSALATAELIVAWAGAGGRGRHAGCHPGRVLPVRFPAGRRSDRPRRPVPALAGPGCGDRALGRHRRRGVAAAAAGTGRMGAVGGAGDRRRPALRRPGPLLVGSPHPGRHVRGGHRLWGSPLCCPPSGHPRSLRHHPPSHVPGRDDGLRRQRPGLPDLGMLCFTPCSSPACRSGRGRRNGPWPGSSVRSGSTTGSACRAGSRG